MLYEVRTDGTPAGSTLAGVPTGAAQEDDNYPGRHFGRVGYVHGPGIDAPVALFKGAELVLPFADWRGTYDKGTCPSALCSQTEVAFPGDATSAYGEPAAYPDGPPSWYGNLITSQQDASGYQYKRNRYHDPKTGRFTQEDPIGLAGGLNTYGFANGDPTSFDDPFGLCVEGLTTIACLYAAFEVASGLYDIYQTYKAYRQSDAEGKEALQATMIGAFAPGPGNAYLKAGRGAWHHIATNKNSVATVRGGPWTPKFEAIFDKASMSLKDALNKVFVRGHAGPHPERYHRVVYERLTRAVKGLQPYSIEYRQALEQALARMATELEQRGSALNKLVTK